MNLGRGMSFGFSDVVADWISEGSSCTVEHNLLIEVVGAAASLTGLAYGGGVLLTRIAKMGTLVKAPSEQRAVRSLLSRAAEHQAKLDAYRANPDAFDNLGFLRRAATPEIRQRIIDTRIRHLETEIATFVGQIRRLL